MEAIKKKTNGQSGEDGQQDKRIKRMQFSVSTKEYERIREYAYLGGFNSIAQFVREAALSTKEILSYRKQKDILLTCQYELNKIIMHLDEIKGCVLAYPPTLNGEETLLVLQQIQELSEGIYSLCEGKL